MINVNVINFSTRPSNLISRKAINVTELPFNTHTGKTDRCVIDKIRCQPKPNSIIEQTTSYFSEDIKQMVELLGSQCKANSIDEIFNTIQKIHETLNDKDVPEVRNWIRILTGMHPMVDKKLKQLGYWKKPCSECMGTNTVLYSADIHSVDMTNWANNSSLNNEVTDISLTAPTYIRENTRHKLDSAVVELIQNAGHLTTLYQRRNLIWEANLSTKGCSCGNEQAEKRPIPASKTHGASLNPDWYHTQRITQCKDQCRNDIINHLQYDGYDVDKLVNHLNPLRNVCKAPDMNAAMQAPLGIEETFPLRNAFIRIDIDNSGQVVLKNPGKVNNDVLEPVVLDEE
jgi:uncharacterized protein YqgV (UPF0045/DUF77 family)